MEKNYTITHLHSDLSNGTTNIDSVTKFHEYIEKAKELGMKAIAFSEHGNIYNWVKKKETCEKYGLKYIHGVETYVTESLEDKIRDNYHVGLYAKNFEGVKEINKMISIAHDRKDGHYYYSPRITFDELINTSDNIIVTTACTGGFFGKCEDDHLVRRFIAFLVKNKHRCFLEVQHHDTVEQKDHNEYILSIHKEYGIRLIAGTDTHALNKKHAEGRIMLQKSKGVHFDNEDGWDLVMRSYDEVLKAFISQNVLSYNEIVEALENTNVLADMVEEFTLDRSNKYPKMSDNPYRDLVNKINDGLEKKGIKNYPNYLTEYRPRIIEELETYQHNKAIDFLLLDTKIKDHGRSIGIDSGFSRGSVSGSVVAYLIGMTDMDAVKHKLNFQRFMNKERVSLADVDTDWSPSERTLIKDYVHTLEGVYTADIITFNTIAKKGAIKDIARALDLPKGLADEINKDLEKNEESYRKQYPELFYYVDIVEGTIVSIGSHPAGVVISPIPLDEHMGLTTLKTNENPVTMINMKEVDSLNFVKLDVLGLDNVEIINNASKMAGIPRLTPDNTPDDEKVWKDMRDNATFIFQWESPNAGNYLKVLFSDETVAKIKERNKDFSYIDLFSVGNGAIRPAGASYRDSLAKGIYRDNGHEALNEFLAPTLGYLVYQEQIIEFLNVFCGYTMGEADIVRRGFSKKTGTDEHIPRIKEGFIKTMKERYNVDRDRAEELVENFLQIIHDASDYLFSLNHAVAYSWIGYVCGYLRYYYPLEFITASLNNVKDKSTENVADKTASIIEYAISRGIKFHEIKFGYSKADYAYDKETFSIYKGVSQVKYLNGEVAEELYELKDRNYDNPIDLFVGIMELTSATSRQIDILIQLNFFSDFGKDKYLYELWQLFKKRYKKTHKDKTKIARIEEITASALDIPNEQYSITEKILLQLEYMEYSSVVVPSLPANVAIVSGVNGQYSNKWVSLYRPHDGTTDLVKLSSNLIDKYEIKVGSRMRTDEITWKNKSRQVNGEWVKLEEKEPHLTKFTIIE